MNVLKLTLGDELRREIVSFVAGETEEVPHMTLSVTDDYPGGRANGSRPRSTGCGLI